MRLQRGKMISILKLIAAAVALVILASGGVADAWLMGSPSRDTAFRRQERWTPLYDGISSSVSSSSPIAVDLCTQNIAESIATTGSGSSSSCCTANSPSASPSINCTIIKRLCLSNNNNNCDDEDDYDSILLHLTRLYVDEWCGPTFTLFPRKILPSWLIQHANYVDRFVLAVIIYVSLYQRIVNRSFYLQDDDYQVFMISSTRSKVESDGSSDDTTEEIIVGAAELSYQPMQQMALPLCLPKWMKGKTKNQPLVPYISNVVIDPSFRGKGYGNLLIQHLEEQVMLGDNDAAVVVYLHVATDNVAAQRLYQKRGYQHQTTTVGEEKGDLWKNQWIRRILQWCMGLYFVQEEEMEYRSKRL